LEKGKFQDPYPKLQTYKIPLTLSLSPKGRGNLKKTEKKDPILVVFEVASPPKADRNDEDKKHPV
jgi:hypothetical protein